ncbi:putative toxin-antitoxin system toxin component, PIN family [Caballeronia sp. 15715]|uniref:putative toxin-antitoxin system toxin component, PIN family n=1 Tax=unclassified Caballeronia TaxID=2646786 RepID=UPI0039E4E02C
MKKSPVLRAVLDSNVWIDILVFDDPITRPIRAALEAGTLQALIDARCLKELTYVLDYPQFARFAVNKSEALETVARLSQFVAPEPPPADAPPLPKCRDRDDQKFLELAHASKADWLVSKDRAVLKLAKRTARDFGFRIAQPAPFVASFLGSLKADIEAYEETTKATNEVTNAFDV